MDDGDGKIFGHCNTSQKQYKKVALYCNTNKCSQCLSEYVAVNCITKHSF